MDQWMLGAGGRRQYAAEAGLRNSGLRFGLTRGSS